MNSSQLIQLMKVLNPEELKAAKKYLLHRVKLPNEQVYSLFLYLCRCAPDYRLKQIDKRKVFKQLFGEQNFNARIIDKLAFLLKNLLQDFLIDYDLSQNPLLKEQLWLQALEKRNHPAFNKASKELIKSFTSTKRQGSPTAHLALFQVNYNWWASPNTQKLSTDLSIFKGANRHLDLFYTVNKLKMYAEYLDAKYIIKIDTELDHYTALLTHLRRHTESDKSLIVQLLFATIKMIKSGKLVDYLYLKSTLFNSFSYLSKQDGLDILVFLNNYCYRRLSKNPDFFAPESYELLTFGDQHDLLTQYSRIRDIEYTNGVIVGCYTQHIDWTAHFIDKYRPFLAPEIREATYTYALSYLQYQLKDFQQVIKLLNPLIDAGELTLTTGILIQSLQLRAYVEDWIKADYPAERPQTFLLKRTNKFEQFITKHKKLAAHKKKTYTQFTRLLRKLIAIPNTVNDPLTKLIVVQQLLANDNSVALRKWLAEKVDQINVHLSTR